MKRKENICDDEGMKSILMEQSKTTLVDLALQVHQKMNRHILLMHEQIKIALAERDQNAVLARIAIYNSLLKMIEEKKRSARAWPSYSLDRLRRTASDTWNEIFILLDVESREEINAMLKEVLIQKI